MEIIASHDLDALGSELARRLLAPEHDPTARLSRAFEPEIVVVPNSSVREFLIQTLASELGGTGARNGVVANIAFVYPRLVGMATVNQLPSWPDVHRVLGLGASPWDEAQLLWSIDAEWKATQGPLADRQLTNPLAAARRMAQLFDHYATHRPGMLREWVDGSGSTEADVTRDTLSAAHAWQRDLYRAVFRRLSTKVRLGVHNRDEYRAQIAEASPAGLLPRRVSVFGVTSLATAAREVLSMLSDHLDVSVYTMHATSKWPTITPRPLQSSSSFQEEIRVERPPHTTHPLHSRWCMHSIENAALLGPPSLMVPGTPIERTTLLGIMRSDVVDDRHRAPLTGLDDKDLVGAVSRGDGSVQVHACFGELRQAEALRDSLLRVLRDDATLRLKDITIACGDPQKFAPLLNAVLNPGSDVSSVPSMPIDATGSDPNGFAPVMDAFLAVVRLAMSRCSPSEVLDVISHPNVSMHMGLERDDLELISDWADRLSVRHGLDETHRRAVSGVPTTLNVGTWRHALRRLAVGVAVPAPIDIAGPGNVVPFDTIGSSDLEVFGIFTEFLERLARLAAAFQPGTRLRVSEWTDISLGVIDDFISAALQESEDLVKLRSALSSLPETAAENDADTDKTYPLMDLVDITAGLFESGFSPFGSKHEAIRVTGFDGIGHRPTRVIAVFGAEEHAFTGTSADGDDALAGAPVVGEPMYSMSGRESFLHAMMAARGTFIVTCNGHDVSNNKPIPLPIPIREFLEVVAGTLRDEESVNHGHPVLVIHKRHNHDESVLLPGEVVPKEPFTFDTSAAEAHRLVKQWKSGRLSATSPPAASSPSTAVVRPRSYSLSDIALSIRSPIEFYADHALGLHLPPMPEDRNFDKEKHIHGDGIIPLTLDASLTSAEGRDLLLRLTSTTPTGTDAITAWRDVRALTGLIPPGQLGDLVAAEVADTVRKMIDLLPDPLKDLSRGVDVDCEVEFLGEPSKFRVTSVVHMPHEDTDALVRVRYRRYTEPMLVDALLEVAALTLHTRGVRPITAIVVCRAPDDATGDKKDVPVRHDVVLQGDEPAQRLARAREVLSLGERMVVAASQGRVPAFERATHAQGTKRDKIGKKFGQDIEYSDPLKFLLAGSGLKEIREEPVTAADLASFGRPQTAANRFEFYAEKIWQSIHRCWTVEGEPDADT